MECEDREMASAAEDNDEMIDIDGIMDTAFPH
jgi:hypothetical protein